MTDLGPAPTLSLSQPLSRPRSRSHPPCRSGTYHPPVMVLIGLALLTLLSGLTGARAASKEEWRGRSVYQLLTDRFAPPSPTAPALTAGIPEDGSAPCPAGSQNWCGGTWRSIVDRLDYIQGMGFDAVWISPTSKNIDTMTAYGAAYHGYWVQDTTLLNPRFGDKNDLLALSDALHKRGMFLMVDIVVNHVAAEPAATTKEMIDKNQGLLWRKEEQYHERCPMDYSNTTSVELCWMGDDRLPLPDVNTENVEVIQGLQKWITEFVTEFGVDGLRIDAAKHVRPEFWQPFCAAAGVFCIGEVYGDNIPEAAAFQSLNYMDSVLNFISYYGAAAAFLSRPDAPLNMTHLVDSHWLAQQAFPDIGLLGSFLGNHDLPRYHGLQVDPRTAWNALVWQFMSDGIPIVYYGDEQEIGGGDLSGRGDPYNRPALWAPENGNYDVNKPTYLNIQQLNKVRKYLIASDDQREGKQFLHSNLEFLEWNQNDVAFRKGPVLVFLTNRGSPSQPASIGVSGTGWKGSAVNILECSVFNIGSNSSIMVSWAAAGAGGKPYVFMSYDDAAATGLCPNVVSYTKTNTTQASNRRSRDNAASGMVVRSGVVGLALLTFVTIIATLLL